MSLARLLKQARNRKGLSLRDVEAEIKISNGYLSQLESGKIQRPSPVHLHALAEMYDISYSDLMQAAGYVAPSAGDAPTGVAFSGSEELTAEERRVVQDMINALRAKRENGG